MAAKLARLPSKQAPVTVGSAIEAFMDEADLAPTTRRVYSSSLAALALGLGAEATLGELEPVTLSTWFTDRYRSTAPATWNRELATLRSAMAWWSKRGWGWPTDEPARA